LPEPPALQRNVYLGADIPAANPSNPQSTAADAGETTIQNRCAVQAGKRSYQAGDLT